MAALGAKLRTGPLRAAAICGNSRLIKPLSTRLQIIVLVALLGAGAALWLARSHISAAVAGLANPQATGKAKRRGSRAVPVIVTRVAAARNDAVISAVGTARARRSIMIHAKSDGVIMEFAPRAGDRLKRGDLVFELDAKQAELAVEIATKRVAETQRLLERAELLKSRRVNSTARVVDAKIAHERAELELLQARKTLSDLKIAAPFDGIVGLPKVEVGDRVTAETPVVSLDQREELLIEFDVPEKHAAGIARGRAIEAVTPSHAERRFTGRIEYIDSRIDPESRTVRARAVVPNDKDILRPGMSFAVEIVLGGKRHAVVPELSLQWRKGESYVWLVRDNKAAKVLVTTVRRRNSVVLIDGPVKPGDLVVVEGVQRLRDGRAVRYRPPPEPQSDGDQPAKRSETKVKPDKG